MKLIYEFYLSFTDSARVENFLQGRTKYALVMKNLVIFHGDPDEIGAIFRMGYVLECLEDRGLDPNDLKYLCCYGSVMPDLVRERHLYPVNNVLLVQLMEGGVLKVYDPAL